MKSTIFGWRRGLLVDFRSGAASDDRAGGGDGAELLGIAVGAGVIYADCEWRELIFEAEKMQLERPRRLCFTEKALVLTGRKFPREELFYRKSDAVKLEAGMDGVVRPVLPGDV